MLVGDIDFKGPMQESTEDRTKRVFFLIEMFIGFKHVTSPANPGDYRLVLIWLVEVKPLPAYLQFELH